MDGLGCSARLPAVDVWFPVGKDGNVFATEIPSERLLEPPWGPGPTFRAGFVFTRQSLDQLPDLAENRLELAPRRPVPLEGTMDFVGASAPREPGGPGSACTAPGRPQGAPVASGRGQDPLVANFQFSQDLVEASGAWPRFQQIRPRSGDGELRPLHQIVFEPASGGSLHPD